MTLVYILLGIVGLVLLINIILIRGFKNPRRPHEKFPSDVGLDYSEIHFPTENGVQLYGWWIPAPTKPAPLVILTHGWGQNQGIWLPVMKSLHEAGFHILSFDARNHGRSAGDGYANMLKFARDILHALKYARETFGDSVSWYALMGFSIGGAATIYAAARAPEVKRVVTLGAFAHPAQIMREGFRTRHVPYFPIVWSLFRMIEWRIGARLDDIAPMNNIHNIQGELLLVHGKNDRTVPVENVHLLYDRAPRDRTRMVILEGCEHSNCLSLQAFAEVAIPFLKEGMNAPIGQHPEKAQK